MRDEIARQIAKRIEAEMQKVLYGGAPPPRQTALRVLRGRSFEVVELDDAGNIIEPCRKCGPVLLCAEHMAMVS